MGRKSLPLGPALLLWLGISAILLWSSWTQVTTLSGWDPDDQLRMVQLRDFLGGQSWFDTTQYRMNAPEGAPMHWSRLIELPLALIVLMLTPLFGQTSAEMVAGAAVPLLLLGAVALILGRIATRLANAEAGIVAILLTLISPALLLQLRPMRIDHHGWQIFFAVLALSTMFWPDKRRGGIVPGLALAFWLHISLEGAPLTAAFFLLLGWRWIMEKAHGHRLAWTISAFVPASLLLFFGTQSNPLATYCDTVSLPHVVAIIIAAAILLPSIAASPSTRRVRFGATAAAGIAALAAIFSIAPQCGGGAFGDLDPLVRQYWYVHINEGLPIWHQSWRNALVLMAMSACGIFALFSVQSRSTVMANRDIRVSGFFLIYSAMLSLLVFRTITVAAAFAIPLIAIWINELFQRYRRSEQPVQRVGLVALMLFLMVPGPVIAQLYSAGERVLAKPSDPDQGNAEDSTEICQSTASVAALAALPNARFVAPFDMGPTILLTTPHQVLASSHHRNKAAMRDHIQIFRLAPDAARNIIKRRGITHIVVCPDEGELSFYVRKDPGGLWARLSKGAVPAWLEPLPDMGDGIKVWRVRQGIVPDAIRPKVLVPHPAAAFRRFYD
jgi:hypothetical protein